MDIRRDRQRWYPAAGAYLRAWRRGKEETAAGRLVSFGWAGPALDAGGFDRAMRAALDRRINAKAELLGEIAPRPWRKLADDYQRHLYLDAADVRSRTRIYRFRTPDFQRRLAHRLSGYDD